MINKIIIIIITRYLKVSSRSSQLSHESPAYNYANADEYSSSQEPGSQHADIL